MAAFYAELDRVWKKLCRETGVIFNFLLGQNGDTLFAGACHKPKPPYARCGCFGFPTYAAYGPTFRPTALLMC